MAQGKNTFGDAYYHIYGRDLPVLVTSDSIMHALHRSFDNMLSQLEEQTLAPMVRDILTACHDELGRRAVGERDPWFDNYRDLDLYLTVGRTLIWGKSSTGGAVESHMDQYQATARILQGIASLELQNPLYGQTTSLFGGSRAIDFSQFQPRGHYTKSLILANYFRTLMWLGRADCGWNVLPPHPQTGIQSDSDRELRDAVLLVDLLQASKQLDRLRALDLVTELFIGRSDNLRPMDLRKLMDEAKIRSLGDLNDPSVVTRLRKAIVGSGAATQRVSARR